jgi:dTDP-4-amino-4,6-dideoxygalactose transaminase
MKVPFLDLKIQYQAIKNEIDPAIQNILDNTAFVLGKAVNDFETAFAAAHGVKYCYGVSSGTDGNHVALWALGIGPGDEVIIPANTFIATSWGATLCGAKPVFADCHNESYNIDPDKVEAAITPNTKAIVAVHLYGQPADLDKLKAIADKHNIFLVEDCAQAHFSEYKGRKVGGCGVTSSFSFYPGKNLGAYGEAGAVVTNDENLALKMKMLRDHGAVHKYYHEVFGHNYRMEGFQGAALGVKLKHLEEWTNGRRRAAAKYKELLNGREDIILPREMDYARHVYHLFVIQLADNSTRDALAKYLNDNEISTGLHYPVPLHLQPCFANLGYKKGDFPVTEKLAHCGLSLPMYAELTDEMIEFVCDKITGFLDKQSG